MLGIVFDEIGFRVGAAQYMPSSLSCMVVEHAKYLEWIFRCKQVEMCTRHVEILDAGSMVLFGNGEQRRAHHNAHQHRAEQCQS
jgi:hypothetical protein